MTFPKDFDSLPAGAKKITLPFHIASGRTLGGGGTQFFMAQLEGASHLIGRLWVSKEGHGPPGFVHGGASAFFLDEAMGAAAWWRKLPVLAARLEFEYQSLTPVETLLEVRAEVLRVEDTRVYTRGEILNEGKLCVSALGEFARMRRSQVEALGTQEEVDWNSYHWRTE